MGKFQRIIDYVDRFTDRSGQVIAAILVFLVAMLVIEVVLRYVFNSPTVWAHEMTAYLFGPYFMLGGAYGILHNSHANVEILYNRAPIKFRTIALDTIGLVFVILICIVLVWHGGELAWTSVLKNEHSQGVLFAPPIYPLRMVIPVAGGLLAIQALSKLIRSFQFLFSGKEWK